MRNNLVTVLFALAFASSGAQASTVLTIDMDVLEEAYFGVASPFSAPVDSVRTQITFDASAPPDEVLEFEGVASGGFYQTAVQNMSMEFYDTFGASLGFYDGLQTTFLLANSLDPAGEDYLGIATGAVTPPLGVEIFQTYSLGMYGPSTMFSGFGLDQLTTENLAQWSFSFYAGIEYVFEDGEATDRAYIRFDGNSGTAHVSDLPDSPAPVPLPASLPLMLFAVGVFGFLRRARSAALRH